MKRPGCFISAIVLALVLGGGQAVFTGISNRSITEIGIKEFEEKKPDAKWLRVTGGELNVLDAAYSQGRFKKNAKELIIPYVLEGMEEEGNRIHLLVKTKDPELMRVVAEGRSMEDKLSEGASEEEKTKAALDFLVKNVESIAISRPIEGLVEYGMDSRSKERDKIKQLFPNLAADFVVLEEGAKPNMGVGVLVLVAGCVLGYFVFRPGKNATPPPLPPGIGGPGLPGIPPLPNHRPPPLPPPLPRA